MSTLPEPRGPRELGVRVKPVMKLKIGYRDSEKRGAPTKLDHFRASADQDSLLAKFRTVYGDQPKAVDVLLPGELQTALDIRYKAWGGSGDDEGGVLKAIGQTNFALSSFAGGPDVLTVFQPDGTVDQVEISGLDDPTALTLGAELYTTFRAGMPKVLGFGSFFEITTKGKASTDTLWLKLNELYGLFGSRVTFAVVPQLVVRPGTARPVIVRDGKPQRIKSRIYVLDLIVPESLEESIARLRDRMPLLGTGGATAAMYGPEQPRELTPGSPAPADVTLPAEEEQGDDQQAEGAALPHSPPAPSAPDPTEPDLSDEPGAERSPFQAPESLLDDVTKQAAITAAAFTITIGNKHRGKTIAEVAEIDAGWFDYILAKPRGDNENFAGNWDQVAAFARVYSPNAYAKKSGGAS